MAGVLVLQNVSEQKPASRQSRFATSTGHLGTI